MWMPPTIGRVGTNQPNAANVGTRSPTVIASHRVRAKRGPMTGSAKQSRLFLRRDSGLLRWARNDGWIGVRSSSRFVFAEVV